MLEESLRNERSHPADTASVMLSFLQSELPAGGAAAESRFFNMYGNLCERIFGPILDAKDDFRHKDGGWLSYQKRWTRPASLTTPPRNSIASKANLARTNPNSLELDPVAKLLGTPGSNRNREFPFTTFIEAIANESESRPGVVFAFKFEALPKPMQDAWLALIDVSMGGIVSEETCSENDRRLLAVLLRKRPEEQVQLIRYKQRTAKMQQEHNFRQPLHISPLGIKSSPSSMNISPSATSPTNKKEEAPPHVMLSMLEYYLFLFLRFPLAAPEPKAASTSSIPGVNVHRIPVPSIGHSRETFGDILYQHLFNCYMNHFLPYEPDQDRTIHLNASSQDSELFLRVLISMWLESSSRLNTTERVLKTIDGRRSRAGWIDLPNNYDLNHSYDLVQLQNVKYIKPPRMVSKSLRKLVMHVLLDTKVTKMGRSHGGSTLQPWCVTPCMTSLQQPFYNYVRTNFRLATIHSSDSPFYWALSSWLMWIEPWNQKKENMVEFTARNATQRIMSKVSGTDSDKNTRRILVFPGQNDKSNYDPSWEPYIAANLYLYAVPLAIFLRRARELDFSGSSFGRSIQHVKRVFRVFTPELVDAVARHLDSSQSPQTVHLLQRHVEILGPYAPPLGTLSMSSLKEDMQSLLEEINMQHMKKINEMGYIDQFFNKIEALFGAGAVSGEEKVLEGLMERAKLIAQLPHDYEILPGKSTNTRSEEKDFRKITRTTQTGELSAVDKERIKYGLMKCDPANAPYVVDRMRIRPQGHEIAFLVNLTIWASDTLNDKFGFPKNGDGRFRINLRFLADYRNTIFAVLVYYAVQKVVF